MVYWQGISIPPPRTQVLSGARRAFPVLVADVHRAQQTANVKMLLQNKSTLLINAPPGCTSRVQPLDVSINKPFKHVIREQFEKHLSENLHLYTENKLPVSERRVLTTKWVVEGWEKVSRNKEMIKRSFVKCGISHNLDGTEDNDISIEGIPDDKLPQSDREFEMDDFSNEEDDDGVLTECEEVVGDNESDSEGDSDNDSNWFSVMYVAVKKIF